MQGRIIRGVGGFYYVHVPEAGIYECRARGIFRKEKIKPLVGDRVTIHVTDPKDMEGSLDEILPRKNSLIRPASANVDQALVVFAAASPAPNLNLLDRFLINMQQQGISVMICFNKTDLVSEQEVKRLTDAYAGSGCRVFAVSLTSSEASPQEKFNTCEEEQAAEQAVEEGKNTDDRDLPALMAQLKGKTTVVAGPSGVGKSTLTNILSDEMESVMEVGEVSRKIGRGRHTTRHTQLFYMGNIGPDTYFLDTPGFSALEVFDVESRDLARYYEEFTPYLGKCRFLSCMHLGEPDCAVKEALEQGAFSRIRYDNYVQLAGELKKREEMRYR